MAAKLKWVLIIIGIIIITGIVSFFTTIAVTGMSDRVFSGVYVRGMHLGGMSKAEAGQALQAQADQLRRVMVNVSVNETKGSFSLADVDLKADVDGLLTEAWSVGRRGNLFKQWEERKRIARDTRSVPYLFSISDEKLQKVLNILTQEIVIPPRDAKLVIDSSNTVTIIESENGSGIDFTDASSQVRKIIANEAPPDITLAMVSVEPLTTTEKIRQLKIDGLLASFTTYFDVTKTNRVYNIEVAASALDGLIIQPGEEFSFNEVVGPRSQEAGYKLAPAILNNEFIDSLGGGVCQVSSTLYNVLLRSGVQVKKRFNHSLAVNYVPLGQDAAVAYGGKDLVFLNNLSCALVIKTSVVGNSVTIKFFGDTSLKKIVKVNNTIIKEYPYKVVYKDDPTLALGEHVVKRKGITGFRVTSTAKIFNGKTLVSEYGLLPSYYQAADQVVLVGTKPPAAVPSPEQGPVTPSVTEQPVAGPPAIGTVPDKPGNDNSQTQPDNGNAP